MLFPSDASSPTTFTKRSRKSKPSSWFQNPHRFSNKLFWFLKMFYQFSRNRIVKKRVGKGHSMTVRSNIMHIRIHPLKMLHKFVSVIQCKTFRFRKLFLHFDRKRRMVTANINEPSSREMFG